MTYDLLFIIHLCRNSSGNTVAVKLDSEHKLFLHITEESIRMYLTHMSMGRLNNTENLGTFRAKLLLCARISSCNHTAIFFLRDAGYWRIWMRLSMMNAASLDRVEVTIAQPTIRIHGDWCAEYIRDTQLNFEREKQGG